MITVFSIHVPFIHEQCPKGQTEQTCALRQYLNTDNCVYKLMPHDYRLLPDTNDWNTARDAIDKMHEICAKCQAEAKQNAR